jgi:hypothetical protein
MAYNIKITGSINSTTTVSRYSSEDTKLIQSSKLQENFGGENDYIEYFVYDAGKNLLRSNYNYLDFKLPPSTGLIPGVTTQPNTTGNIQTEDVGIVSTLAPTTSSIYPIIEIDPVQDLQNLGYSSGEFQVQYNFFQNKISDYSNEALFIKEISQDRTEIRLASLTLSDDEIENLTLDLIDQSTISTYYVDYLLNFSNNEQYVAVNVALNKAPDGYEVLFKLYNPLPLSVKEKMTLWVVEEIVSPYVFDINLDKLLIPEAPPLLRGPNFDIEIPNNGTVSTAYNNYSNLVSSLQSLQNSSYQQILNLLATQSVDINIDYTDFNNFVFFGSAYQRVTNFYTKVKQIEDYNNLITTYTPLSSSRPSLITEINTYSSNVNNIISQFDGYESYLYFESSSYAWPKAGSTKPFSLLSTGSSATITWYSNLTGSAEDYDLNNYDNLEYAVPAYLKNDDANQPFLLFLNMVGHYFDNIWIYLSSITDINLANNNLEKGISKDLVYERLKSLGVHLYNAQAGEDVNQYLIGANTGSSIFPYTPVSGNDFTVTGSFLNNIPRKDLVSELYKRIYHNLPLLLKTKGTVAGLEYLNTTFGITSSILNVKEYGGSNKAELINGYNRDKVRIVSNTINGNVLSPLLSFQTFPTASDEFRDGDMHYIDISFSPETQMDTYTSGAISSNDPSWRLDEYIGDPRQLYNGSYTDLDTQRTLYYQTGVPGFAPFTGSALDYNGFIRLIQYFDNSLFKMLADFVPERASLSTGVTINSPILERNKVAYANPTNSTTQSVPTAQYPSSSISSQYGTFYNTLSSSNNTMGWYDGELSGSIVNVNQYFTDNYNPYLGDWNVYNASQPAVNQINQNTFLHSDWNVLLNNVSQSVTSSFRNRIEYIWGTTGSILTPAELQDSYLSLRSYNISRYEGSKTISDKYNTYTDGYDGERLPPIAVNGNFAASYPWDGQGNNIGGPWPPIPSVVGKIYSTFFTEAIPGTLFYNTFQKWVNSPGVKKFKVIGGGGNLGTNEGKVFTLYNYSNYYYTSPGVLSNLLALAVSEDLKIAGSEATATDTNGDPSNSTFFQPLQFELIYGDDSYGKTAAIDRYTRKIGLFTRIESSSFLPKRNNVSLKYLIDEFGSLTELNQQNNNWSDIQRIFLMNSTASVALFDNKKFSNQKNLDGQKAIFDSGYSYSPILYGSNKNDLRLYFERTTLNNSYQSIAGFVTSGRITGPSPLTYPLDAAKNVTKLFPKTIEDNQPPNFETYPTAGPGANYPSRSYSVTEGGAYDARVVNVPLLVEVPGNTNGSITYELRLQKRNNNTITPLSTVTKTFTFAPPNLAPTLRTNGYFEYSIGGSNPSTITLTGQPFQNVRSLTINGTTYAAGTLTMYRYILGTIYDNWDRNTTCTLSTPFPSSTGWVWSLDPVERCTRQSCICQSCTPPTLLPYLFSGQFWIIDDFFTPSGNQSQFVTLTAEKLNTTYQTGEKIQVVLQEKTRTISTNYTASILNPTSRFTVNALANSAGNYPYSSVGNKWFADPEGGNYPPTSKNQAVLDPNLTQFYSSKFQFLPTFVSASNTYTSSLYSQYGDVEYPFQINPFDIFVAYDMSGSYFESRILDFKLNSGSYGIITLSNDVPDSLLYQLGRSFNNNGSNTSKFLFLKRIEDETNTHLILQKRPGGTSYGFLIPDNLSPDVIKNIDTITSQVKQRLLADQQGSTS